MNVLVFVQFRRISTNQKKKQKNEKPANPSKIPIICLIKKKVDESKFFWALYKLALYTITQPKIVNAIVAKIITKKLLL